MHLLWQPDGALRGCDGGAKKKKKNKEKGRAKKKNNDTPLNTKTASAVAQLASSCRQSYRCDTRHRLRPSRFDGKGRSASGLSVQG